MPNFQSQSPGKRSSKKSSIEGDFDIHLVEKLERYRAFMTGYVRRINEATFKVNIGGVRIGLAKYSRLAQINLKTRIITFSCYAIENVPERGRRYLVLHELAHVKEASHNKRFWQLVEEHEPNYREIDKSLEMAFKQNIKKETAGYAASALSSEMISPMAEQKSIITNANSPIFHPGFDDFEEELLEVLAEEREKQDSADSIYNCDRNHFLNWTC